MLRLPRLTSQCDMMGSCGLLILMTSAPNSAKARAAVGPAQTWVRSSTRTPFNAGSVHGWATLNAARRETCVPGCKRPATMLVRSASSLCLAP